MELIILKFINLLKMATKLRSKFPYLFSNYWGIQCSSISAFYDDETQKFLERCTLGNGQWKVVRVIKRQEDEEEVFFTRRGFTSYPTDIGRYYPTAAT